MSATAFPTEIWERIMRLAMSEMNDLPLGLKRRLTNFLVVSRRWKVHIHLRLSTGSACTWTI
jgi:hypothetical protein